MNQQEIWNKIAPGWTDFRNKPLKGLYKLNWKKGKILDIGCGNCRNLLPFKNLDCYGVDFSREMLEQARKFIKKNNFKVNLKLASAEKLPYQNNSFDYVLALAVLHHLKNPETAIKEIHRVLKNNGEAYISIWSKLQLKLLFKKKETFIPWKQKNCTLMRYYHFVGYFELKSLLKKNNFKILKSNFFGKNIKFLIKKI